MIRILVADDHAIVRDGLRQLFELFDDITVAGEASNGGQVLEAIRSCSFDVVLLDMSMPGISGVELISRIRLACPEQPVLVLSMHAGSGIATRAFKAGASGYMSKDCDANMLVAAIRKVAAGDKFLDPAVGVQIVCDAAQAEEDELELLSDREHHILGMLVHGMGVNEIARELCLSNKTVSTHKMRMMKKLNVDNNAELLRYAISHGLTD